MCGRYTLRTPLTRVAELFDLDSLGDWAAALRPRYNVAPTQSVAAIRWNVERNRRELVPLVWGLVPHWADEVTIGNRMINARAETLAAKPAFRDAFRRRRCLIIADGFFEWQKRDGSKQPYYIRLKEDRPFAFAGLWDRWDKGPRPLESCTIVTTDANELLRPLHDRMPVILDDEACRRWLDQACDSAEELEPLLHPFAADAMLAFPVSTAVNSPRRDEPECIEPAAPAKRQGSLFD
ncbi:MAG: SOS response-associated peptidase [Pirellulales bacterium]